MNSTGRVQELSSRDILEPSQAWDIIHCMWAIRRRLYILLILVAALLAVTILPPVLWHTLKPASCTDGVQNGGETGVDCGGSCLKMCYHQQKPLKIQWSRILPVDDTVYSLAFSVENQNFSAFAYRVPYQCTIVDREYSVIKTLTGTVSIPPAGEYISVETSIAIPVGSPEKVFCKLAQQHTYIQIPHESLPSPFAVDRIVALLDMERPRISATIYTKDQKRTFNNVEFIAAVYDAEDSLVGVSKTLVPRVQFGSEYPLVYTWPNSFMGELPHRVEITPIFEFPEYQKYQDLP